MPDTDQAKPSLETLKKRAKQIVRWHRDRVYTVAEPIRNTLPRFASLDDQAIFAAPFRLSDAQEMIARQNGFASWQALKAGLEPLPDTIVTTQPVYLQAARPVLYVKDIHATCDFFEDVLGFRTVFKYGEPPYFGVIARDGAQISLRCVDTPLVDRSFIEKDDLIAVGVTVSALRELKQLFAEFTEAAADFHQPLKKQPWGGHDFMIKDPDGNLIHFSCAD